MTRAHPATLPAKPTPTCHARSYLVNQLSGNLWQGECYPHFFRKRIGRIAERCLGVSEVQLPQLGQATQGSQVARHPSVRQIQALERQVAKGFQIPTHLHALFFSQMRSRRSGVWGIGHDQKSLNLRPQAFASVRKRLQAFVRVHECRARSSSGESEKRAIYMT